MPPILTDTYPSFWCWSKARRFLKSTFALLACLVLVFTTIAAPVRADSSLCKQDGGELYCRYEAHTPQGKKNLESFRIALRQMKAMGCENPLSWYYQGAIHWVPTRSGEISGIVANGNPLCPYYSDFPIASICGECINDQGLIPNCTCPPRASDKLLASWDNCTHNINQAGAVFSSTFFAVAQALRVSPREDCSGVVGQL